MVATTNADELPSFRDIYDSQFAYAWNLLRRLGVPQGEVEDKVHDVFIIVYRRLAEYDRSRPIRPWIGGICVREAANHRRHLERKRTGPETVPDVPDASPGAEELLAEKEKRELFLSALETLDDGRRAVLVLHDIEGLPMHDIATLLDEPMSTLYSRLRQSRDQVMAAINRLLIRRKRT